MTFLARASRSSTAAASTPSVLQEPVENPSLLDRQAAVEAQAVVEISPPQPALKPRGKAKRATEEKVESSQVESSQVEADDEAVLESAAVEAQFSDAPVSSGVDDLSDFEQLFEQWRASNDPALRERLILMNRNLVAYLARRFAERGESMDDIVQQGLIGLIYALDHFDSSRGIRFATFATPTIIGEIRRYFRDKTRGVRMPRRAHEMNQAIVTRIETLTQEFNRSPTYREIAQSLSIPVEDVIENLESSRVIDPVSIDEPFADDELVPLAERIGGIDPALAFSDEQYLLREALSKLPEKYRVVLHHAYFENKSQIEIARQLHVSQMHVSRLLRAALTQLRKHLEEDL